MKKTLLLFISFLLVSTGTANALDTIEEYLKEYPNQQQVKMMNKWLAENEKGTFWFSGLVTPEDDTVILSAGNRQLWIQLVLSFRRSGNPDSSPIRQVLLCCCL